MPGTREDPAAINQNPRGFFWYSTIKLYLGWDLPRQTIKVGSGPHRAKRHSPRFGFTRYISRPILTPLTERGLLTRVVTMRNPKSKFSLPGAVPGLALLLCSFAVGSHGQMWAAQLDAANQVRPPGVRAARACGLQHHPAHAGRYMA